MKILIDVELTFANVCERARLVRANASVINCCRSATEKYDFISLTTAVRQFSGDFG